MSSNSAVATPRGSQFWPVVSNMMMRMYFMQLPNVSPAKGNPARQTRIGGNEPSRA